MTLPAWLIEQLQQEQLKQEQQERQQLELPLYYEELPKEKDEKPKQPIVIEL